MGSEQFKPSGVPERFNPRRHREESEGQREAPEPELSEEQRAKLDEMCARYQARAANALQFAGLGEERVDERELEVVRMGLRESMQSFGFTGEQIRRRVGELDYNARREVYAERIQREQENRDRDTPEQRG